MLKDIILEQSYWFKEKKIQKAWRYKRDKFFDLSKKLSSPNRITALIGPRQTGKTTIFFQLIDHLIKNSKTNPENILYLSFDHPLLKIEEYNLDQIFQVYQEEFLKQTFRDAKGQIFIFLDEIQKSNNWQDYLKYWIDLKLNICFFISGSSSIQIIRGGGESLIGRLDVHFLLPLSYPEAGKITKDADLFETKHINLFEADFQKIKKFYQEKNVYDQKYHVALADYLQKGGYPEIYNLKNSQEIKKYLLTLKSLSIHRDIVELEQIRDPKSLENTLTLLAGQNANRVNYENIAGKLGIKLDTIKKYISYLESAFLVKESYILKDKFIQSAARQRKIFFLDTGLKNAVWAKPEENDLFENLIFIEVLRKKLEQEINPQMFYGLSLHGQEEIDVIWQSNSDILPIEVKYKNKITKADMMAVSQYLLGAKEKRGIIINKSEFRLEKDGSSEILIMPYWLFLMIK